MTQWKRALHGITLLTLMACGDKDTTALGDNQPPWFSTVPPEKADHDLLFTYGFCASDPDGDSLSYQVYHPAWITYDSINLALSGTPGELRIGESTLIRIVASDGLESVSQVWGLKVVLGTSSLIFNDGKPWDHMHLGHDGDPHLSENFAVWSGFSSTEARQYASEIAEEAYRDHQEALSTGLAEFDWLVPDHTIDVFANKYQDINNGLAFREGFVVRAWDTPGNWWTVTSGRYRQLVRHELMHVMQGLLIGPSHPISVTDVWFTEGVADHMAGGSAWETISSSQQLVAWQANRSHLKGGGNPVSVRSWGDFPQEVLENGNPQSYYAYFELAFRYLVDPAGHGKTLLDLKQIYFDIRAGMSFPESFATRMGMTVDYFEEHFFDLMMEYLQ